MKSKLLFGALLGSIALTSCTAEEDIASVAKQESPIKFAVSMEAAGGALTKAEMSDAMKLNFNAGDLMSLYHGNNQEATDFTSYQNAIYEGAGNDGQRLVFTTKSMVLKGHAVMVYPCDTAFLNTKDLLFAIEPNQDAKSKELLPFASEILNIGDYREDAAEGTAGYGKYYPIVLKQIGSTLKLVTIASNTEKINGLEVAPLAVSDVEMIANRADGTGAFNTKVALKKGNETPSSHETFAIWEKVSDVNVDEPVEKTEKLITKDVKDNFTAVFSLLPSNMMIEGDRAEVLSKASVKINTNYGYVELMGDGNVWNKKDHSEDEAVTVGKGIGEVLSKTWVKNESSTNFYGEKTGGSFYRTIAADMSNLNMNGLHIKDAKHLVDALKVYDNIKASQEEEVVTFYLDGKDGVFTMTPEATAAYVEHLGAHDNKIVFQACQNGGDEMCGFVKFTCEDETEVPEKIKFGESVSVLLEGTWKYSNENKEFENIAEMVVVAGSTLNVTGKVGASSTSFPIKNYGTVNVSGVTYLNTLKMGNYNVVNIAENAELRVMSELMNGTTSLESCGEIYNSGVLATVESVAEAKIINLGYIKQMTETSKTYITENQTENASFSSEYSYSNEKKNVKGTIELFDKNDDNYSVSNEKNEGFIMVTTTAEAVGAEDFGEEANYVKIAGDCTALDFTPEKNNERVKYIEIASSKEVVWTAKGNAIEGLIMKEGTKMNMKKSNTLWIGNAYLKGTIYKGGLLTVYSCKGYLGGDDNDRKNIITY